MMLARRVVQRSVPLLLAAATGRSYVLCDSSKDKSPLRGFTNENTVSEEEKVAKLDAKKTETKISDIKPMEALLTQKRTVFVTGKIEEKMATVVTPLLLTLS